MKPASENYSSTIRSHQAYLQFLFSKVLAWIFILGLSYEVCAQSIINGSFEQGPAISGRLLTVRAFDSSTLTGWTVASNDLEIITSVEWPAERGNRSIDLNGITNATLFQDVGGLIPGCDYILSFSLSGNPFTGGDSVGEGDHIKNVRVSAGGTSKEFTFDVRPYHHPVGSVVPAMGWMRESIFFTANTTTQRIQFESLDPVGSSRGPAIDNVSITQALRPLISCLKLEQSTNLIEWETVKIAPSMLDSNGKILIPSDAAVQFYRLQFEVLSASGIGSEPSSTTITSDSSLKLEQSTNLIDWETVEIAPAMLDSNGKILIPSDTKIRFYRLQNQVQVNPTISTHPMSATITSGSTAALTVVASGIGPLSYQWYRGAVGTTTTPVGPNAATLTTAALTTTTSYWVRVSNPAGSVNSQMATVTVNAVAPSINAPPASASITSGSTAILTVAAGGTAPLTYQWYQGAVGTTTAPIGTNSATLTTAPLTITTSYWVQVSNSAGNVDSPLATVTVSAVAPSITTQPASMTITSGNTATLTVAASSTVPLAYQWYQGALGVITTPVGTNSTTLTTAVLTAQANYWVRVSNSAGSVNSQLATVVVVAVAAAPTGFALIPAGTFTMGDGPVEVPPMTKVTIMVSPFYIGKHEVTKAQWDEVRAWGATNGYTDLSAGGGKASNHPVHSITWFDMVKWCNARSQKDGLTPVYTVSGAVMKTGTEGPTVNWSTNGYRLPTEAEWEKAARGGVRGKRFPWGTDTISHSQANFWNGGGEGYNSGTINFHLTYATASQPYTSPVGSFAANAYGLHDMAGNVMEHCWDYLAALTIENGVVNPRGPANGTTRVLRGGSWYWAASVCRVGDRRSFPQAYSDCGFRLARSSVP